MQPPSGQSFHVSRVNDSFVASTERQVLAAIAASLPEWVSPDKLTVLGVLGGAITGISCLATYVNMNFLYIAVIGVVINWFGDSLDGSLARFRGIERKTYGLYVDRCSDVASHFMMLFGLGLSPLMHLNTALMALLGSLLVMFYELVKLPFSNTWQVAHFGWGPTEMRILIIGCFLIDACFGQPSILTPVGSLTILDVLGLIVFVVGVSGVAAAFWVDRARFAKIDPPRALGPIEAESGPIAREPSYTSNLGM